MPISANIIDNPTNESRDVKTWAENGAIKATSVCVGAGGRSGLNRGGIAVELKKTLDALARFTVLRSGSHGHRGPHPQLFMTPSLHPHRRPGSHGLTFGSGRSHPSKEGF